MATVDLKGAYRVTSKGKTYWYAWKGKGAPRLHGEPGSPEFVRSLAEAIASRKVGDEARMKALIAMFRQSDYWRGIGHRPISEKTKASWTTWLDRIQVEFGDTRIAWFDKPEMRKVVVKWRNKFAATPRAADMGVQVLSRLLSFGQEEGKLLHNICNGIGSLYASDRSELIWTAEDLARLEAVASPEVLQAATLAALTGLRQGDLLRMRWWHIKERSIEIEAAKSGRNGRKPRKAIVPLYGALKDYLATLPKRATTVLVNTDGDPWKGGFGSSWGAACERAGIAELHFHDLRGTAATNFALAGFNAQEIALIMAWSQKNVQAIIDRYVNQQALLEASIRRMDEHNARTDLEKQAEKPAVEGSSE